MTSTTGSVLRWVAMAAIAALVIWYFVQDSNRAAETASASVEPSPVSPIETLLADIGCTDPNDVGGRDGYGAVECAKGTGMDRSFSFVFIFDTSGDQDLWMATQPTRTGEYYVIGPRWVVTTWDREVAAAAVNNGGSLVAG